MVYLVCAPSMWRRNAPARTRGPGEGGKGANSSNVSTHGQSDPRTYSSTPWKAVVAIELLLILIQTSSAARASELRSDIADADKARSTHAVSSVDYALSDDQAEAVVSL